MYRCEICKEVQEPGLKRTTYYIYRPDGNIAREIPVCINCHTLLKEHPLEAVLKTRGRAVVPARVGRPKVLRRKEEQPDPLRGRKDVIEVTVYPEVLPKTVGPFLLGKVSAKKSKAT